MNAHPPVAHRLGRLRIALDVPSREADPLSDSCSRLFHGRLRPLIASVLDAVELECGELEISEPLVLDLGALPLAEFDQQFCQRLEPLLLSQLRQRGRRRFGESGDLAKAASVTAKSRHSPDALAQLASYLEQGVWPAALPVGADAGLGARLLAEAAADPQRWLPLLARQCLKLASLRRLRALLGLSEERRLGALLAPDDVRAQTQSAGISLPVCALRYFQRHSEQPLPEVPRHELGLLTGWASGEPSRLDVHLLTTLFSDPATAYAALAGWLRALWRQPAIVHMLREQLPADALNELEAWASGGEVHDPGPNLSAAATQPEPTPAHWDDTTPAVHARELPVDAPPANASTGPSAGVRPHASKIARAAAAPSEPLLVSNAGACLLWPLLPSLWRQLGLMDGNAFIDARARHNAASWLDELVWGDGLFDPARMRLNRLLCDLPWDAPLGPTPPDGNVLVALQRCLQSLPGQVPSWKKLGVADVRRLFLQRPGWVLQDGEGSITIHIEPQPYDVLLQACPWPIDLLPLPWLAQPWPLRWETPPGLPPALAH